MRGQQGHNSFNRPVKAAVGRNRNGAADSQMTAVESVPSTHRLYGADEECVDPKAGGYRSWTQRRRRTLPRRRFPGAETGCPEESRTVL